MSHRPDCGDFIPSVSNGFQCFDYTFTGVEGVHFFVALPVGRLDALYGVTLGPQTDPDTSSFSYDSKATSGFMLRTGYQIPAGKKITILVATLTA